MDIDSRVELLLSVVADEKYFESACSGRDVLVRLDAGGGKGKGLFAAAAFAPEQPVLLEAPLVAMQHSHNKSCAWACGACARFIGPLETQVARALKTAAAADGEHARHQEASVKAAVPTEIVFRLFDGGMKLPGSAEFCGPRPVACLGGCSDEKFCSTKCAEQAWEDGHRLLCPGKEEESCRDNDGNWPVKDSSGALRDFLQHADVTNDIFLLAAKAVAHVLMRCHVLLVERQLIGGEGSSSGKPPFPATLREDQRWQVLLEAWKPYAMGFKLEWWDSVAVPVDVENELTFRNELKDLADESLDLLKAAVAQGPLRSRLVLDLFPEMFHLRMWGALIGMFELNNLSVFVASPVLRWLAASEDSDEARAPEVDAIVEALSRVDEEAWDFSGSAFYPLQACINHSCIPNAHAFKRNCDDDGSAVILALSDIPAGAEITISYIDEDAPLEERREALRDYGFVCKCERCQAEELAAECEA